MSEPSTDLQSPAATFHEKELSLKAEHAAMRYLNFGKQVRKDGEHFADAASDLAAAAICNAMNARAGGDGWRPIAEAPYDTPVEVKAGRMTFLARLLPDVSETEAGESCDQWHAEIEGEHPPCWSGGACWSSNEDEDVSLQPSAWHHAAPDAQVL